ncbi:hypothetical protein GTQ40_14725 [Flavobacteriaceae bacterium R38]|nr:hypothetical protein [Flavobacteriaceae bacterium R38]
MLKSILKLEGSKQLDKAAQNEISGGHGCPPTLPECSNCPAGQVVQINPLTGLCFCVPA